MSDIKKLIFGADYRRVVNYFMDGPSKGQCIPDLDCVNIDVPVMRGLYGKIETAKYTMVKEMVIREYKLIRKKKK